MKAEVKGNELVITLPMAKNPPSSKSGKTLIVSTTAGIVDTGLQVNGKPLKIGVNAFIGK